MRHHPLKQNPLMNCPYCSIHNLRGVVGVKAHIRHSHPEKMTPPGLKAAQGNGAEALSFQRIIGLAEFHEKRARDLREAADVLASAHLID